MLFILGIIPYVIMGMILASMGYYYTNWQWWGIFVCMFVSDAISMIKTFFYVKE